MSESDECPLCMEVMEIDDLNFFPCSCGYQICRFCWHRIRTDENGLCPACRKQYSEDPAMYQPLSKDEVIQKNLLFVVGLSQRLADIELLKKHEYFGKYGKIMKVIINPSTNYAGPQGPSASAYITYSKEEENLKAILAVNNIQQDGRTLRVSLGTTKYCTHFLRNMQCKNPDCMYLHEMGDDNACFTKEDMQQGKHLAYERDLLENFQKTQLIRRKSQDIEQEPQQCQQKEEWPQEINEGNQNSALPARAAWAEKECEKDANELEKERTEEDPQLSSSWSSGSEFKDRPEIGNDEPKIERSDSFTSNSPAILGSSLPKEILHPTFATGWATSEETKEFSQTPNGPVEDRSDSSYMSSFWPVSDLGLKNLRVTNDDELGFDPFDECNKGLADLLASEKQAALGSNIQEVKPNASRATWPDLTADTSKDMFTQINKDVSQQYSLFGNTSQGLHGNSFFGSYFNMQQNPTTSGHHQLFGPEHGSPFQQANNFGQNAQQPQKSKSNGTDVLAWQDGLRALLPNVNISFSASKRPPPGFDSSSSQLESSIWTKINQNEKQNTSPSGIQPHPFPTQANVKPGSVNVPAPDQMPHPVTPWNAIVGRAHASTGPLQESLSSQGVEVKTTVKPVTAFAKGNPMKSQKPTAKVKPQMKCVVSPTVEAQPIIQQAADGRPSSLSRMNDLDDISLTDPLPLPINSGAGTTGNVTKEQSKEDLPVEVAFQVGTPKKSSKKKKKTKERPEMRKLEKPTDKETNGKVKQEKGKKEKINEKIKPEKMKEPIKIQQRPKQPEIVKNDLRQGKPPSTNVRPDPPKIRILKTDTPSISATTTMTQSSPMESGGKGYPGLQEGHEVFSRLAESTEKLLQTVLSETEVIKSNTEQISKDLKSALEKYKKEPTLSDADWKKINYLLSSPMANGHMQGKAQKPLIDTLDLERQVESAKKEAEILEVRLNDVIRKNMATEVENNGKNK
eukprot:gene12807-3546_t